MFEPVIVLNADMNPLNEIHWKEAVRLVFLDKAEVLVNTNVQLAKNFFLPKVIRLLTIIKTFRKSKTKVPWTKRGVALRDDHTCQYCGKSDLQGQDVTVDHIIPRAQGGKSTWENTVLACFSCNNKKDNRTPTQAKMKLRTTPKMPSFLSVFRGNVSNLEAELVRLGVW